MEISIINPLGSRIVVLYNGSTFVFYSEYYGTMAIARRSNLAQAKGCSFFTLTADNNHCIGGRFSNEIIADFAKRFINKSENKYIKTQVDFETHFTDLSNVQPATLPE